MSVPRGSAGHLMPWAHASDTPFRAYKHFTQEGGIATPLIAHWPAGMPEAQRGTVTDAQGPIMDVMATALDAAGTACPEAFEGRTIAPMEGKACSPYPRQAAAKGMTEFSGITKATAPYATDDGSSSPTTARRTSALPLMGMLSALAAARLCDRVAPLRHEDRPHRAGRRRRLAPERTARFFAPTAPLF